MDWTWRPFFFCFNDECCRGAPHLSLRIDLRQSMVMKYRRDSVIQGTCCRSNVKTLVSTQAASCCDYSWLSLKRLPRSNSEQEDSRFVLASYIILLFLLWWYILLCSKEINFLFFQLGCQNYFQGIGKSMNRGTQNEIFTKLSCSKFIKLLRSFS